MPRISEFFGIGITMYYNDHNPPHFHASYAGAEAMIGITRLRRLAARCHGERTDWCWSGQRSTGRSCSLIGNALVRGNPWPLLPPSSKERDGDAPRPCA